MSDAHRDTLERIERFERSERYAVLPTQQLRGHDGARTTSLVKRSRINGLANHANSGTAVMTLFRVPRWHRTEHARAERAHAKS
jgi:hypothetical protein